MPHMLDRKPRTEKSAPHWFSSARGPVQNDRCVVYPLVGKKGLGRDGSLGASGLMPVRKSANRKSGSHGFSEGEQLVSSDARL